MSDCVGSLRGPLKGVVFGTCAALILTGGAEFLYKPKVEREFKPRVERGLHQRIFPDGAFDKKGEFQVAEYLQSAYLACDGETNRSLSNLPPSELARVFQKVATPGSGCQILLSYDIN